MKVDQHKTRVIFRRFKQSIVLPTPVHESVIAIFPDLKENAGLCRSYTHVGQHGAVDYLHILNVTVPAMPVEYKDLKIELKSRGYNIRVSRA